MDHSIEDGTAQATFDLLVSPATCLQLVADEVLIAIDLRFRQRTSVIATGLFPRLASLVSKLEGSSLAKPYNCHAVGLSVFAQRDEGPNRGTTPRRGQGVENLLFVIRTIPACLSTWVNSGATCEASFRWDVNVWATTSPVASWTPTCSLRQVRQAVLTDFPLALTVDFQAGRIYHQVHRFIGAWVGNTTAKFPSTRQGRVIRRRQFQLHQVQKRLDKALMQPASSTSIQSLDSNYKLSTPFHTTASTTNRPARPSGYHGRSTPDYTTTNF